MTPASEAIKGLAGALAMWKCDRCSGRGWNLPRVNKYIVVTGEHIKCDICDGTGKHPVARAALSAFEGRARLRDDRGPRAAALRVLREVEEGHLPAEMGTDDILDALDAALFGPATPPTPEERER